MANATLPDGSVQRPPRIIVAEDDQALRQLFTAALEHRGYEIIQASTGNELVERMRRMEAFGETVDLLISDVRMPKMNGLVVLKFLRDAEFNMPVILVTAFGDLGTRREAEECGAVLLDKPVRLRTLRDEVEAALSGRRNRPSCVSPAS